MKVAVLPGDGIGTENMREAVKVLNGLGESFEFEEAPVGGAGYDASGDPLPDRTLAIAKEADAILLGATGDWKYDKLDPRLRPEQGMLRLRKELHFFANLRPAFLYEELIGTSPLKPEIAKGLDILIVRELNGDVYFASREGRAMRPMASSPARGRASILCATANRRSLGSPTSRLGPRKSAERNFAMSTRPTCSRPPSSGAKR
jgi:3-isopropylmalate dehydrogenase